MTIVERTLTLTQDDTKDYCWAEELELEDRTYAFALFLDGASKGRAHLNDTAKAMLYPNETARPFKADSTISGSRSSGSMTVNLDIDDQTVHTAAVKGITQDLYTLNNITHSAISNSTKSSDISYQIIGTSPIVDYRVKTTTLTFYFYQYTINLNLANRARGVQSVSISDPNPYFGNAVTATAELIEGAKWYGWYADPEHTELITDEQTVTWEAGGDLVAYAYASLPTGFKIKQNGTMVNAIDLFRKTNGVWVPIEKNEIDISNHRYIKGGNLNV